MSVQLQRLLMMMATIMMAFATLTACEVLEDNNDENGKEEEGGNGGGGVSGKRLKKMEWNCSIQLAVVRSEYTYNSDGFVTRSDMYDSSSKLVMYSIPTYNTDGTTAKAVAYDANGKIISDATYSYNSNKKPQKMQGSTYMDGNLIGTYSTDYTFQNGKKTFEVQKINMTGGMTDEVQRVFEYDSKGKRTVTTQTSVTLGASFKQNRTYNTDGTLQKVTYPYGYYDNTTVTITFTWENGKSNDDIDDLSDF